MLLTAAQSQLILVDYQQKLMPAIADAADVLRNAALLAKVAELMGIPAILTEQTSDKLGTTVEPLCSFNLPVIAKSSFDACKAGLTDHVVQVATPRPSGNAKSLPKHLQKPATLQRTSLVIAGVEAHICLLQTALSLLDEEEFEVYVVVDACSSRTHRSRDAAFDRLASAGAELVTAEMVVYEWLGDSRHPHFKAVLDWVK